MNRLFWIGKSFLLCAFVSSAAMGREVGAETNAPAAPAVRSEENTNSQELLRAYLQLQEQLHETQLAIERTRQEAKDNSAQTAETLTARLQTIERALGTQRAQELEAIQSSNKIMLIISGTFAGIGFVAMLLMAYFQWRTVSRLAEISAALPATALALPQARAMAALTAGDSGLGTINTADQSNQKLLSSLERLEKRIFELEHTASLPLNGNGAKAPITADEPTAAGAPAETEAAPLSDHDRVALLLNKGQTLLNSDKTEEAVACFNEALGLEPRNAEAMVKKGIALEKLRKFNEAIECYDRAILADRSMTIAHLHKGGLLNRLERFSEALECYEEALRTQERKSVRA